MILTILFIFFCIRLISLKILMQHAKQLKVDGAVEYGIKNSKFLAITHVLIYMSAAIEAFIRKDTFSLLNGIGLIILIIAYIMLFIVIKTLGRIWTLKLFILPNHPIIKSGLYKVTKHPNYFFKYHSRINWCITTNKCYIHNTLISSICLFFNCTYPSRREINEYIK